MTNVYAYTPEIWPPLAAAIFLAALSLYSWRRRDVPAAQWLAVCALITILWLLGIALEAAAVAPATKFFWRKFQQVCQVPAMTAVTCFVLEYTYPGRWLTRRNLTLLWIPPLLVPLLVVLNGGQLVWRAVEIDPTGDLVLHRTGLNFLVIAYGIGLVVINVAALLWLFARSPQHRWPVALMLFSQIVARGLYLVNVANAAARFPVDPVVVGIVLGWIIYAIALFGFRIFDPLPAARQAIMEQMHAGVAVLDARWRLLSLNPVAEAIFGVDTGAARGKTWQELAPSLEPLPARGEEGGASIGPASVVQALPEMTFGSGSGARYYAPSLSALEDARGLLLGHLLILRDVTEEKRVQGKIVEQQRSLAAVHEREHLARELHDSIGQVLSYAALQVKTTEQLIEGGRPSDALIQLGRLGSVLSEAHADVRQTILDLRVAPSPHRPFFEVLWHYLNAFQTNYDIETTLLTVGDGFGEEAFHDDEQVAMFRILQEALSNARRHGHASRVQVAFAAENGIVRMSIEDNGCGIDPDRLAALDRTTDGQGTGAGGASHFGLDFMRERARELGGRLQIESAPGAGTRVVVEVPRKEG